MDRADVERNQRTRLYGAMIESVSQRGYHDTTVAHVIGLAGVSRRAFYEQFANKEQCFLETYDVVMAEARKRMLAAWARERGWVNRLHAACQALLDEVAASPKGPRLVLVDALGIPGKARERMQLGGLAFERLVASAFATAPEEMEFPKLTSRAVVGGVRHVLFMHMLEQRERDLHMLSGEVLEWIGSYRIPAAAQLGLIGPARPRHVPPAPASFLARDDRRARLLGAVVHLTLDSGYNSLTDAQIAQFAGTSTEAFHRHFANKQECFLTVLDEFVQEAVDSVRPSLQSAGSWPEGVHRAIAAFVDHLVAHQALLRIAFIDLFEVGPAMIDRMRRPVEALTKLLVEEGPAPQRGPAVALQAVTGAVWVMIATYVANDRLRLLPLVVDQLAFTVLAPYVGPKAAIDTIAGARRPLGVL